MAKGAHLVVTEIDAVHLSLISQQRIVTAVIETAAHKAG
jgi:hypothetical protein